MDRRARAVSALLAALAPAGLGSIPARACPDLEVIGTTAQLFEEASNRGVGARIEVRVRSTSTAALSALQLGVFFGAGPQSIARTRVDTLAERSVRLLEEGGLAFRARLADEVVPPGAERSVRIERAHLPPDRDFSLVAARVIACATASPDVAPRRSRSPIVPVGLVIFAAAVGLLSLLQRRRAGLS